MFQMKSSLMSKSLNRRHISQIKAVKEKTDFFTLIESHSITHHNSRRSSINLQKIEIKILKTIRIYKFSHMFLYQVFLNHIIKYDLQTKCRVYLYNLMNLETRKHHHNLCHKHSIISKSFFPP